MSGFSAKISVIDEATPAVVKLSIATQPALMAEAAGRAAAQEVRDNFIALDAERHIDGGRHFYVQAAHSVSYMVAGLSVFINISDHRVTQRFFGGRLEPTGGLKWLTIPNTRDHPEAYGHRAGEFSDLVFIKFREDLAALVLRGASTARNVTPPGMPRSEPMQRNDVMFWLKKSVDQAGDPTVLPTVEKIRAAAVRGMGEAVAALTGGGHN